MELLRITVIGAIVACSRSPSTPASPGAAEAGDRKAPVLRELNRTDLGLDLDRLSRGQSGGRFVPGARVVGTDPTASLQLPGGFPGKIVHVAGGGSWRAVEGRLVADAPLQFVRDPGGMRALALEGSVAYAAVERVTAASAWSATASGTGCCGWWENTLWRAAPGALDRGLLRAVTPPSQAWSVLDWHLPEAIEPRWRIALTGGDGAVVAAAVSPRADQLVTVFAAHSGAAVLQARRLEDGAVTWSAELGGPAAEWRRGDSRVAYRRDGARVAVLVEDPARCEACTAIEVYDAARGERLKRFELETVIAPRFASIGLDRDTAWVFEHVTRSSGELADRPQRSRYEAHDAAGRVRRADPGVDWGLDGCTVWALAPRFDGPGVIALAQRGSHLVWLGADEAP